VQECTSQIMLGAAAGAVPFAVVGYQMAKARGAIGGALIGAVIGAFSGLDSALPAPRRTSFDRGKGPVMGPFRAGASYVIAALACALGGFYLWGTITLECTRGDGGVLCSRVTTGWLNNAETSRVDYGPIVTAYEGGSDQIVFTTPEEHRGVIDGFDITALSQLKAFLASAETRLVAKGNSMAIAPPAMWAVGTAVGLLGVWSLLSGIKQLRKVLAEPKRPENDERRTKNEVP
jgi:hypothetical protein